MESKKFSALGLGGWLTRQIAAVGFKDPKPIQENCIPPILEGMQGSVHYYRCNLILMHRQGLPGMC